MAEGTTSTPPAAEAPRVLDRYRLVKRLGTGGFGTVWKARDEHLQRDVALKILPRERVVEGRFEREALAAARLAHPAIVTLFEAATDEEGAYLVSELVAGLTLERALERGRLSDRAILDTGVELCDALAHAHLHGIVHRDVKPSNILVPSRPSTGARVKLTDFGVARVLGGATLTSVGERIGTAAYMAPEQAEGRNAGEAADLYSLALVLYEGFAGLNPVPDALARPHARRLALRLPPLRRYRRDLPRGLAAAIDLALRPNPRERGTVAELRAALLGASGEVSERPGVVEGPAPRTVIAAPAARAPEARRPGVPAPGVRGPGARRPGGASDPTTPRDPVPTAAIRAAGALAAAGLAVWAASHLFTHPPVPPATAGLVAALLAIVAPRIGWLALTAVTAALLLSAGRAGLATLVVAMALLPVALLPRGGALWGLGALGPALAAVGIAGAWPAVAARAGGAWRGASLAVLGWVWLWLAAAFAGHGVFTRAPAGLGRAEVWARSPAGTLHHVIVPLLSPGLAAGAAVWGLAALLIPAIPRLAHAPLAGIGPSERPRAAIAALAWSVATAAATVLALDAVGAGSLRPSGAILALGVFVSTAVLLAPRPGDALARRNRGDAQLA